MEPTLADFRALSTRMHNLEEQMWQAQYGLFFIGIVAGILIGLFVYHVFIADRQKKEKDKWGSTSYTGKR